MGFSNRNVKDIASENKSLIIRNIMDLSRDFSKSCKHICPLLPGIIAAGLIIGLTNVINTTAKIPMMEYGGLQP